MIISRDIDDLWPAVQAKVHAWMARCLLEGLDVVVYCTYRDNEAQDALYASGRTINGVFTPGPIKTNSKGGQSFHQFRCAVDFFIVEGGKPAWNDSAAFTKAGDLAKELGMEWAGDWRGSMRETDHIQYTQGLTLEQLAAGGAPQEGVA